MEGDKEGDIEIEGEEGDSYDTENVHGDGNGDLWEEEKKYSSLLRTQCQESMSQGGYYFSYSYDLSSSMQRNAERRTRVKEKEEENGSLNGSLKEEEEEEVELSQDQFEWNTYAAQPLKDLLLRQRKKQQKHEELYLNNANSSGPTSGPTSNASNESPSSGICEDLDENNIFSWFVPIIHGFVMQKGTDYYSDTISNSNIIDSTDYINGLIDSTGKTNSSGNSNSSNSNSSNSRNVSSSMLESKDQTHVSISASKNNDKDKDKDKEKEKKEIHFTIIARRSRHFAGARYLRRGVDCR